MISWNRCQRPSFLPGKYKERIESEEKQVPLIEQIAQLNEINILLRLIGIMYEECQFVPVILASVPDNIPKMFDEKNHESHDLAFVNVSAQIRFRGGEYIEWYAVVSDLNEKTLCIGKLAGDLYAALQIAIIVGIFNDVDEDFLHGQLYLADPLRGESILSGLRSHELHKIIE